MADLPPRVTQEQWDALDAAGEQVIAARLSRIQRMKRRNIEGNTMSDTHTAALDLSKLECWDWEFDGMSNKPNGYYFYRADVEALFRAAEGQAQTSAVAWTKFADRCPPEHAQIFWRHGKDAGTGYFMEEDKADWVGEWMFPFAAQLADSAAPGVPVDESDRAGWFIYEGNCWVATSSDDPRAKKLYRAVPTAQQSLTAGLEGLFQRKASLDFVQEVWNKSGRKAANDAERRAMQQAFGILARTQSLTAGGAVPDAWRRATKHAWEYRSLAPTERMKNDGWLPLFAAAPLPQVQSEALDAARYHFLRDQNGFEYIGSFAPYAVQGQTMNVLTGVELDSAIDAFAQQAIKPSVDNDGGVA